MREAAIILCGGFSRRMGRDKWALPFGNETLLDRTVRIVREALGEGAAEVVVVAREGQEVVAKDGDVVWARDPAEGRGPLAGLAAGLRATAADRVFLTSCDTPFLTGAHVRRLLDADPGCIAVPRHGGHFMVTAAVYPRAVQPTVETMLAEDRLRPLFLLQEHPHVVVDDAHPDVFFNVNTPADYAEALRRAGL